jgi:hypothetical protein
MNGSDQIAAFVFVIALVFSVLAIIAAYQHGHSLDDVAAQCTKRGGFPAIGVAGVFGCVEVKR